MTFRLLAECSNQLSYESAGGVSSLVPHDKIDAPVATPKNGAGGYRSRCLSHAKRALYHLSYSPLLYTGITSTKSQEESSVYMQENRAVPGIEPGTSCTRSRNHTTRPNSQCSRGRGWITVYKTQYPFTIRTSMPQKLPCFSLAR